MWIRFGPIALHDSMMVGCSSAVDTNEKQMESCQNQQLFRISKHTQANNCQKWLTIVFTLPISIILFQIYWTTLHYNIDSTRFRLLHCFESFSQKVPVAYIKIFDFFHAFSRLDFSANHFLSVYFCLITSSKAQPSECQIFCMQIISICLIATSSECASGNGVHCLLLNLHFC